MRGERQRINLAPPRVCAYDNSRPDAEQELSEVPAEHR